MAPRVPSSGNPFGTSDMPPAMATAQQEVKAPQAARAPDGEPTKRPRHVLRPVEEYMEFEEESQIRIDRSLYPDGFDLQWVTEAVWGKPEPANRARYERAGWVPVHQEDFDGAYRGKWMPQKYEGEITYGGLVLMARSAAWSERARGIDLRRAQQRVMIKEQQLRNGDLTGVTLDAGHKTALAYNMIERSIDTVAMPVPKK